MDSNSSCQGFTRELVELFYDILTYPNCGGDCVHHKHVEVYNRSSEDSETGLSVFVEGETLVADKRMHTNPSDRRDGVRIGFYCETCPAELSLKIVQDRGTTFMSWDVSIPETEQSLF